MKCLTSLSKCYWQRYYLFFIFVIMIQLHVEISAFTSHYFRSISNAILLNETETGSVDETFAPSRIACVSRCPDCSAVAYDETTLRCRFSNHLEFAIATTVNPDSVWINRKTILFNVRREDGSELSAFEAAPLCLSLGNSQIVDPGDMYDAKDLGYSLCRCGFASYGSPRMIMNQTDPDCLLSNGATTVISCKTISTSPYVYCKLV